jgi:hypothetical protein
MDLSKGRPLGNEGSMMAERGSLGKACGGHAKGRGLRDEDDGKVSLAFASQAGASHHQEVP